MWSCGILISEMIFVPQGKANAPSGHIIGFGERVKFRQLLWLLLPVKADWTISIKPDRSISKIAGYDDPVFGGECYRILVEGQGRRRMSDYSG